MKVYYVANARMPSERAHGIQLAKMCEAFMAFGIDLELVLPRYASTENSIEEFYNLSKPIKAVRLPAIRRGRWRSLFLISALSFMVVYTVFFLMKRIRGERAFLYTIDLDHFSFLALPFIGFPYAIELHGKKKRTFLHTFFFRHAEKVVAINSFIKDDCVKKFGISPERIIVAPNGIDRSLLGEVVTRGEARGKLRLPLEARIVCYIGRLYAWKGLEILPAVARKLGNEFLVLVVGGSVDEFMDTTGERSSPENLRFVGGRPLREMQTWISASDVCLVLGTKKNEYSYFFTSPMKFFEYMALRRPIIASDTPANREIVSPDEAILYAPDDADDLAGKIRGAFNNPDGTKEKVDRAHEKVSRHTWDARAKAIIHFLNLDV